MERTTSDIKCYGKQRKPDVDDRNRKNAFPEWDESRSILCSCDGDLRRGITVFPWHKQWGWRDVNCWCMTQTAVHIRHHRPSPVNSDGLPSHLPSIIIRPLPEHCWSQGRFDFPSIPGILRVLGEYSNYTSNKLRIKNQSEVFRWKFKKLVERFLQFHFNFVFKK